MEEKKKQRGYIWLIIILVLLVLSLGSYIVYDKVLKNDVPTEVPTEECEISELVYNAKYEKNVSKTSYTYNNGIQDEYYYVDDIVVPYINIDSESAKKANAEIKKIHDELVNDFKTYSSDGSGAEVISYYNVYKNDEILSVVMTVETVDKLEYYTYNFDLKSGELLSFKDLYTRLRIPRYNINFNDSNIDEFVSNAIRNSINLKLQYADDANSTSASDVLYNESIKKYEELLRDNKIGYFMDAKGQLNVITEISDPWNSGCTPTQVIDGTCPNLITSTEIIVITS